ncbi:MAG TPA: TatD family hydrolase [Limnochordales bacterium]
MTTTPRPEAPPLVDTHVHLDDARFDEDREAVLRRAGERGVRAVLSCSTDLDSARRTVALARRFATGDGMPAVAVAVGIHPHEAGRAGAPEAALEALERLAAEPEVRAIGEIGLDFHYDFSPRDVQQEIFERQLDLAQRLGKPVSVHAREAESTVLAIIRRYPRVRGVLHAFAGDREQAEQALALGWYLGVGGMLTFRNADAIRAVIGAVPLERLVLETDAPYLAPVPHRGQRNEPAHVALVAESLARLRGLPVEAVAQATTQAAVELFGLELQPDRSP